MNARTVLLAACLLASACLENEESIEVRPDGSIEVELSAKGDAADLTRGYSVPLQGPWQPRDDLTRAWVRDLGPATGGAAVQERFAAGAWTGAAEDADVTLAASAEFPSAADLPEFLAPATDPYRTAFQRRRTSLAVEPKGGRTVYVFEREYGPRPFWDPFDTELFPQDVRDRIDAEQPLDDEQVVRVAALIRERAHTPAAMRPFTSAVGAVYTDGDAALDSGAFERTMTALHRAVDEVLSTPNVRALFEALHAKQLDESATIPDELDLQQRLRDAAREVISGSLERERVDPEIAHAMLERLEWNFTSLDDAKDLEDEKFTLRVALPGVLVDGNYDSVEDGRATWKFEGQSLFGSGRVLRAVSVLE